MDVDLLSLFPGYFRGPFDESILKRAQKNGLLNIQHTQLRDFASDKHKRVDDRPYGGGPGMVLKPEPVVKAVRSLKREGSYVIYPSAKGTPLTAATCRELSQKRHLIFLCGYYEGVDERAIEEVVDQEISIGEYVLTNGALAAIVMIDAIARFIPGVLGHAESANSDSFESGLLEYPQYTRPETFEGKSVPEVLQNGNHQKIAEWKEEMALKNTCLKRPDLYALYQKRNSLI